MNGPIVDARGLHKHFGALHVLKGVDLVVPDDVRDFLAQITFDKSMEEGARGAPRAVNQYVISPVIGLLSPYAERGDPLPASLQAVRMGAADIKGAKVVWEISS